MLTFATICTGVGGFDLGLQSAGMRPLWMCESDAKCQAVLRHHWPSVPCHGDLRFLDPSKVEHPDVLAAGTPCQGFSIAGLQMSLDDCRSNLCLYFVKLTNEFRNSIIVWENVPGCLSTKDNAFGHFLGGIVGADSALVPPRHIPRWKTGKRGDYFMWPSAGVVAGPKRTAAWRVLDSQFFGVAQRRQRVFVVADCGDGSSVKILFEPEMLRRHLAPSKEKGKDVAGTLGSCTDGSGPRTDPDRMTFLPVQEVAMPLCARDEKGVDSDCVQTLLISGPVIGFDKARGECTGTEIAGTLRCNSGKSEGVNDGKADNQCIAFHAQQDPISSNEVTPALGTGGGHSGQASIAIAFQPRYFTRDNKTGGAPDEVAPPLTGENHNGDSQTVIAFQPGNLTRGKGSPPSETVSPALMAENDGDLKQCVAFRASGQEGFTPSEVSPPIAATDGGGAGVPTAFFLHSQNCEAMKKNGPGPAGGPAEIARTLDRNGALAAGQGGNVVLNPNRRRVRRLTPTECERLQGFPDRWTLLALLENQVEVKQKDSPRYKQLGNAVTQNVARWIGRRIMKVLTPHSVNR
jgi:DNA (cytosine-5)-methyltransferase 1